MSDWKIFWRCLLVIPQRWNESAMERLAHDVVHENISIERFVGCLAAAMAVYLLLMGITALGIVAFVASRFM